MMHNLSGPYAYGRVGLLLLGCLTGTVTLPVSASGPPIAFDSYTVSQGEISATCPASAFPGATSTTCEDGVADDGMLQRRIVVEGGDYEGTYIQFILTESGVSGEASADPFSTARDNLYFSNEDFVRMHHRGGGIASRTRLIDSSFSDPDTEERFVSEINYRYGWAQDVPGDRWVETEQRISTVDYGDTDPIETFYTEYDFLIDGPGFDSYADVTMKQGIDLDTASGTGIQKFQFDMKAGDANGNSCGSFFECSLDLDGDTLTWNQAETLTAFWIGQVLDNAGTAGDTTFGHTRFENRDTLAEVDATSLSNADAAVWPTDPFTGTVPVPGEYVFDFVDTIAGNLNAWDPDPVAFVDGMPQVTATATPTTPAALQPTVAAGAPPVDTSIVSVPLAYDGWTVSNGVFVLDACSVDLCLEPFVNKDGLMQRIVIIDGVEYVHTIVTGENATGDPEAPDFDSSALAFKNESFVRRSDLMQGVAARLHIAERDLGYQTMDPGTIQGSNYEPLSESAGEFVYTAEVKTGWAHGGQTDPILTADQTITLEDPTGIDASSWYHDFSIRRGETASDTALDMLTVVGSDPSPLGQAQQPVMHATSVRAGAFNDTTHTAATDPDLLPGTGGDIDWAAGDAIQATWVGGNWITSNPGGFSAVNSLSYTNLSTGDRVESTVTDADADEVDISYDPDPETWASPFDDTGTPDYTDPFVIP